MIHSHGFRHHSIFLVSLFSINPTSQPPKTAQHLPEGQWKPELSWTWIISWWHIVQRSFRRFPIHSFCAVSYFSCFSISRQQTTVFPLLLLFSKDDYLTFLSDLIDHSLSSLLLSPSSLQCFHSLIHSDRHWTLPDLRAHRDGGKRVGGAPVKELITMKWTGIEFLFSIAL